jgi:hypothetical protein
MQSVVDEFGPQICHNGYIESPDEYRQHLTTVDIVLSTATQEFQGLAVMEAVQQGCIPLLPDRLCYPEFFAPEYRYTAADGDPAVEGRNLAERLSTLLSQESPPAPQLKMPGWRAMAVKYEEILTAAAGRQT